MQLQGDTCQIPNKRDVPEKIIAITIVVVMIKIKTKIKITL